MSTSPVKKKPRAATRGCRGGGPFAGTLGSTRPRPTLGYHTVLFGSNTGPPPRREAVMEAGNEIIVRFSKHAMERAGERGADLAALHRAILGLAPRLAPFAGHRVALVRRGQPIPVVRPTSRCIEVITVLAKNHQVLRSDTIAVTVG